MLKSSIKNTSATTARYAHLPRARERARETIMRRKNERLALAASRAAQEAANVPLEAQSVRKSLLAMLYWAEGTKSDRSAGLTFTNTDPLLSQFFLELLRDSYQIDESKLRIRVHIHAYHDQRQVTSFWSKTLRVPESQFGKIYVKNRSTTKKFRENFRGICFIRYGDGMIRRELLSLGRKLAEAHLLSSFNG